MKYQATWNGQVVAEADESETLIIETNVYFPPSAKKEEFFKDSDGTSECPWKGHANYYNLEVNGETNENAAWYYAEPKAGSPEIVAGENGGRGDFSNFVAFWRGVEVNKV